MRLNIKASLRLLLLNWDVVVIGIVVCILGWGDMVGIWFCMKIVGEGEGNHYIRVIRRVVGAGGRGYECCEIGYLLW